MWSFHGWRCVGVAGDALHQAPPIGHVVGRVVVVAVDVADVGGGVPAQPVERGTPPATSGRCRAGSAPDLGAPVVGPGVAPRGLTSGVVVEVDAALAVLAPAVEPPQVEVGRAEVVVDDIERTAMPRSWAARISCLRARGPAVRLLDGEDVRRVVAPREVGGELRRRHQLDGVDPQVAQVVEPLDHAVEAARPTAGRVVERADMQLVDHELVPRRHAERRRRPSRTPARHDGVAGRIGHRPGVGVVAPQRCRRRSRRRTGTRRPPAPRRHGGTTPLRPLATAGENRRTTR